MKQKFTIAYSGEAIEFLESLPVKAKEKVENNISKAAEFNDRELFKKIDDDIWEFRTLSQNLHIRLFAFWDKREIEKAKKIKSQYFNHEDS